VPIPQSRPKKFLATCFVQEIVPFFSLVRGLMTLYRLSEVILGRMTCKEYVHITTQNEERQGRVPSRGTAPVASRPSRGLEKPQGKLDLSETRIGYRQNKSALGSIYKAMIFRVLCGCENCPSLCVWWTNLYWSCFRIKDEIISYRKINEQENVEE
jgi:hypothetical protein